MKQNDLQIVKEMNKLLVVDLNVLGKQPAFGEKAFLCVSLFIPTFDRLALSPGDGWYPELITLITSPTTHTTNTTHTQNALSCRPRARGRARSASSNESLNKDGWLTPDGLSFTGKVERGDGKRDGGRNKILHLTELHCRCCAAGSPGSGVLDPWSACKKCKTL